MRTVHPATSFHGIVSDWVTSGPETANNPTHSMAFMALP